MKMFAMQKLLKFLSTTRRILVLEDNQDRIDWFENQLLKGQQTHFYRNAKEALNVVRADNQWDLIMLDHDLVKEHYKDVPDEVFDDEQRYQKWQDGHWREAKTGYNFAESLCQMPWIDSVFVIIHSMNNVGNDAMKRILPHAVQWHFAKLKQDYEQINNPGR